MDHVLNENNCVITLVTHGILQRVNPGKTAIQMAIFAKTKPKQLVYTMGTSWLFKGLMTLFTGQISILWIANELCLFFDSWVQVD